MRTSCFICLMAVIGLLPLCFCGIGFSQQMAFPGAAWQVASPESVLVDPQALDDALELVVELAGTPGTEEMVIIRNGRLIWEGSASDRAHHTWSATKSLATTALGLVIDDGLVTLDTLVKEYVPAVGDLYPEMTLRHAATHTSGYLSLGETSGTNFFSFAEPKVPLSPGLPLFSPPGSQFAYSQTPLTQMMHVLTLAAGEPMQDLFQRRIGNPIGIDPGNWDWGHYLSNDGIAVDGGGGYPGRNEYANW